MRRRRLFCGLMSTVGVGCVSIAGSEAPHNAWWLILSFIGGSLVGTALRYVDVARELGMEERAGRRYERWYRSERGLPPAGSPGQFR